jgi:hypothetical protein
MTVVVDTVRMVDLAKIITVNMENMQVVSIQSSSTAHLCPPPANCMACSPG